MHIDKMRFQNNMSNGYIYIYIFFWEMSNGYGSSNVPITRVGLIILFDWFVWTVIYLYIYILKMQSIEIKMTY